MFVQTFGRHSHRDSRPFAQSHFELLLAGVRPNLADSPSPDLVSFELANEINMVGIESSGFFVSELAEKISISVAEDDRGCVRVRLGVHWCLVSRHSASSVRDERTFLAPHRCQDSCYELLNVDANQC